MSTSNFDTIRNSVVEEINAGVKLAVSGTSDTERGEQIIAHAIITFAASEPVLDFGSDIRRTFTADMLDKSGYVLLRGHDHTHFTKDNRKDLVNALIENLCPHAKWSKKDRDLHGELAAAEHNSKRDEWVRRFKRGFDVAGMLSQVCDTVTFDPKAKAFLFPWDALNTGDQRLVAERKGSVLLDGKAPVVLLTSRNKKGDDTITRFKPTVSSLFTMFKSTSDGSNAASGITMSKAVKFLADQGDKLITMELSADIQKQIDALTNQLLKRREYLASKPKEEHPAAKAA